MSPDDARHHNTSIWSRRAVLGAVAAVPALVVPFGATARAAARRPGVGTDAVQIVTLGSKASFVSGQPGKVPNGIRLTLALTLPDVGDGTLSFDKLFIPNVGERSIFSPGLFFVARNGTITLDVGPLTADQVPTRFDAILVYSYYYDGGEFNEVQAEQELTIVPLPALVIRPPKAPKPPKPPKPPRAPKPPKPPKPPKL
jgi:hypothetical protein